MAQDIPGGLSISNEVIADLAGYAAMECYGVVGMTTPGFESVAAGHRPRHSVLAEFAASVFKTLLPGNQLRHGIVVGSNDRGITVDLYVIVEYGTNIATVSSNLKDNVRFVLTDLAGVTVDAVEVHVEGVKIRK